MTFKIAIMADSHVGLRVLEFMLDAHPEHLVGVVLVDEAAWGELPEALTGRLPPGVRRLTWQDRRMIKALAPDVLLLAWWPLLLAAADLDLAPTILNMHPSLLPHCRGKDPNFWAIVEQRPFGVTLHHVDTSIDGGPIAFQREIAMPWTATGETLYRASLQEMVSLFIDSYPSIAAGEIPRRPADQPGSLHYRSQLEPACRLSLDGPTTARQLLNLLRARTFPPHPACRFEEDGEVFEVRVDIRRVTADESARPDRGGAP